MDQWRQEKRKITIYTLGRKLYSESGSDVRLFKGIERQNRNGTVPDANLMRPLNTKVEEATQMSTHENTPTEKLDVYARVTDQIINAIEKGVGNWKMPWHTSGRFASSPINATSRKAYRGINTVCLWAAAESKGYESGEWATYAQWQERKAQVRNGEKATTVVFWKFANGTAENQDGDDTPASGSRLLFTRGYSVFNAAQVDGYTPKSETAVTMPERIERAETWFQSVGADLRHGGNRAYYSPASDAIQMPLFAAFPENVAYYSTLAHEHMHNADCRIMPRGILGGRKGGMPPQFWSA